MIKKFIMIIIMFSTFSLCKASEDILKNYANIAEAKYSDSLLSAEIMLKSVNLFLLNPSKKNLQVLKNHWLDARKVYQQTEVFRFGNPIVDDWEGKVNAWPLDEGLIDYVDATKYYPSENDFSNFNIVANKILKVEGSDVDATEINFALLENKLHEIGGNEANVATGYHAIEFLLWGQDLNGSKAGSGNRSYTDFSLENCTKDNCDRRRKYLKVVTELLIKDLQDIKSYWSRNGIARKDLLEAGPKKGLTRILTGMGSLSYGELAGERMKLGLMLHDPEEEHDCFSDNTHNSHFYNVVGIQNVYLGKYQNINGEKVKGQSISDAVAKVDIELDKQIKDSIQGTLWHMQKIVSSAENGVTYDMLISEGNIEGNKMIQDAIDALVIQSKNIEKVAKLFNIRNLQVEGSDSLDNPEAVFN
jgi:putative iron-regulated protein